MKVRSTGDLEVSLKNGKLLEQKPLIYQKVDGKRLAVDGAYKLLGEKDGAFIYGFNVASYDHTKKIVIDPLLAWSTYLGGANGNENGRAIAVDSSGAAYVTGDTTASNFPVVNPVQGTPAGGAEVFITKINPSGTALVYSTYLGGSLNDFAFGIAVDSAGSAYVTGNTSSQNFPLMNPVQATNPGGSAAFITKLSPTGSALVYSTLLGGGSPEEGHAIAVDSTGAAYVTGLTRSTDFPVVNPIQATYGGGSDDAFITKINPAGSAYVYSTYLGGNGGPSAQEDIGNGIAVDNTGAAYVVGLTVSPDFPVMNPIQPNLGSGFSDAFITKVNPAGSALVYSTYLGGVAADQGFGIAIDGTGAAYVTGQTDFQDFPLVNPIQGVFGGTTDAFVTKIDPTGSIIVYSTFLGGSHAENGSAIAVGSDGSAYITGQTLSTDFPVVSPVQATIGGGGLFDTFVTEINPAGSAFVFSTYLGGTGDDVGFGIAVDSAGSAYIVGRARSTDFPLVNPIQTNSGFDDAYVAKIGTVIPPPPPPVVTVTLLPDITTVAHGGTLGYNVTAMNTTAVQQCFEYWENANLPDGSLFPTTDSLFKPVPRLCLNAGASKTVHLTHGVPMSAPLGAYVFNSYVGIFPFSFRAVVDTTSFNFNVTALGPLTNHPATSWRLMENGFRK